MWEAVRTGMRLIRPSTHICDRAREQLSAQLDHELPELDRARLDVHLETCGECRSFGTQIAAGAHTLRAAPLEEPRFVISVPRRRFVSVRSLQAGAAAAAVALVAGLATMSGVAHQTAAPSLHLSTHAVDRGDELVPGHVPKLRPQRLGERLAL
jgi:predicted anti-sigma-YlaC factor YlaD